MQMSAIDFKNASCFPGWGRSSVINLSLLHGDSGKHSRPCKFPTGAVVKFAGMELEADRYAWQGSQIPLICFDEIQEFSENQFWFLVSRNRSMSGARSRMPSGCRGMMRCCGTLSQC